VFNGELVFAGTFDTVGSQPIQYIARWDGTTVRPLGTGLAFSYDEADVRGLAVFNNELYAAGQFDQAGGVAVNGIARWDGTTWRAVGTGLRDSVANVTGYPRCLHAHGGLLVCGGEFDRAGGVAARNVAAWNGTSWAALGSGSFAPVYALASYGSQLVAQGQFQVAGNVAMVAAWSGTAWTALGSNGPTAPGTTLCAVGTELWTDENTTLRRFDGTAWSGARAVCSGIFSGFEGTSIRALHAFGSELIVGGEFTRVGAAANAATVASANVVAFDRGTAFRALGGGRGLARAIRRMLPWRGGWAAVGGFDTAGTAPATGLALFDGDRWTSLGRFSGGLTSPLPADIAVWQGDLIATGDFTQVDGVAVPGMCRHDGVAWRPFGARRAALIAHGGDLYAYGGATLERWNGSAFVAVASTGSIISNAHSHRDGRLYLLTDDAFNHRIWSFDGVQLQQIGVANDFTAALGSHGSDLVVGGRFSSISGVPAALLARWNGTSWRANAAPLGGYSVTAIGELDGELHVGANGDPRGYWLAFGNGSWRALGGGTAGVPTLLFADRATASMIGSGDMLLAGSLPVQNVAEWRTQPDWQNRLHGTPGAGALPPLLLGRGVARPGAVLSWTIEGPPNLPALFGAGTARIDQMLFGALLVPLPEVFLVLATDASGTATVTVTVPPLPPGLDTYSQAWLVDAAGPQGFTASNALQCTTRS